MFMHAGKLNAVRSTVFSPHLGREILYNAMGEGPNSRVKDGVALIG